jgi:hypothetical protein
MNVSRPVGAALLALALLAPAAQAQTMKDLEDSMSYDGLKKAQVKGLDMVYTRPGATLGQYKKVRLDPVTVAFHRNWDPKRPGSMIKISTREKDDIRNGVAKIVQDEFAKALTKGGYQVVSENGPDVLRVTVKVVNLYVNAPDTKSPGAYNLTLSAGEMTMFTELHDSESGESLARVVDRQGGKETGLWTLSGSVTNSGEAEAIAAKWAGHLRKALDTAKLTMK